MERSDRTDGRRHSQASARRVARLTLALAFVAVAGALAAGTGRLTLPASALDACPPGVAGALTIVSRPLVPVGATVVRGFTIEGSVSEVKLSAPAEYRAAQVPGNGAYVLRLTAPRAGAFTVQATWTQQFSDGSGQSCAATAAATLTAGSGTPLALRPPPAQHYGVYVQHDDPMAWTWRCSAGSDPTPVAATIRWEVDPRPLKPYSRGGNAPFRFTRRSKAFTVRAVDACDGRLAGVVKKRLPQGANLRVIVAGSVSSGGGELWLKLTGGFRNPTGNKAPFHLGITLRQGPRTLVAGKFCAWDQSSFLVARGKGISCWW